MNIPTLLQCSLNVPLKNVLSIGIAHKKQEAQRYKKWCCLFLIFFSETIQCLEPRQKTPYFLWNHPMNIPTKFDSN
jgi:hypothetical protein